MPSQNLSQLLQKAKSDLLNAKKHLTYSFNKVSQYDLSKNPTEEQLEALESFASRFGRFSDIAIQRYFKTLSLQKDPAFRGSLIDLLNMAEKYEWIDSLQTWMRIRELRNFAAHKYSDQDYIKVYLELIKLTPILFKLSLEL